MVETATSQPDTKPKLGPHILISLRMPNTIFGLLKKISNTTNLSISELIRRATKQYLLTAPEDLPLDLKAAITRLDINNTRNIIKDIRYIYHKTKEARRYLNQLKHNKHLPPHTITILTELETTIQNKVTEFDKWLATHQDTTNHPSDVL